MSEHRSMCMAAKDAHFRTIPTHEPAHGTRRQADGTTEARHEHSPVAGGLRWQPARRQYQRSSKRKVESCGMGARVAPTRSAARTSTSAR